MSLRAGSGEGIGPLARESGVGASEHVPPLTLKGCQGHSAREGLCSPANPQSPKPLGPRTLSHPR